MYKKKKKKRKNKKRIYTNLSFIFFYIILSLITLALLNNITRTNTNIHSLYSSIDNILEGRNIDILEEELEKLNQDNKELSLKIEEKNKEKIEMDNKIIELNENNEELIKNLATMENELKDNKNNYTNLYNKYEKLVSYTIPNVITFKQYPNYPTGCEAVGLYILLKYYGVNVSVDNIVDSLPKGSKPYENNGVTYGGNPNYEFLGNPRSSDGWGIWNKGIANVANTFKSNIIDGTGMEFDNIYGLIRENRPVLVWTTVNLNNNYETKTWITESTGEKITWKKGNHVVVIIGYNSNSIIVSDPIDGKIKYFNKYSFINIYNYMGKRVLYY